MFDAYCSHCERRGLYTMRRVLSMETEEEGFVLTFRCYCGTVGSTTIRRLHRGPDDGPREQG